MDRDNKKKVQFLKIKKIKIVENKISRIYIRG